MCLLDFFKCIIALLSQCGKWPYSFATFAANKKVLLDIADLEILFYEIFLTIISHLWLCVSSLRLT